jgi:hypothetical protein
VLNRNYANLMLAWQKAIKDGKLRAFRIDREIINVYRRLMNFEEVTKADRLEKTNQDRIVRLETLMSFDPRRINLKEVQHGR